jgi:hypothetical protein
LIRERLLLAQTPLRTRVGRIDLSDIRSRLEIRTLSLELVIET